MQRTLTRKKDWFKMMAGSTAKFSSVKTLKVVIMVDRKR